MNALILFIIGIPAIEIYLMIKVGSVIRRVVSIANDYQGIVDSAWPGDQVNATSYTDFRKSYFTIK